MITQANGKVNTLVTFVGVILLLIGIYSSLRTALNFIVFKNYPTTSIYYINLTGVPPHMQRDEDCMYLQTYFTPDGKTRPATPEEKANEKEQQRLCLTGVRDARENAKASDVSSSLLFLFLGLGILTTKRFFFK